MSLNFFETTRNVSQKAVVFNNVIYTNQTLLGEIYKGAIAWESWLGKGYMKHIQNFRLNCWKASTLKRG